MTEPMLASAVEPPTRPRRRAVAFDANTVVLVLAATIVIAALAVYRLRTYPYHLDLRAAIHGAATTASATAPAAARTWTLVGVMVAALAGWLRRRAPDLARSEAVAAAVIVLWSGTYLCLLVLGPFNLYRPAVLRALVVALLLATVRRRSRGAGESQLDSSRLRPRRRRWPAGAWIAVLALALAVVPLFLLQLGSPVSPFMDTLPQAASPERIVTFRFYDPYHNDPAGLWAQTRQMSGHDALFSFVALTAGTNAQLAMTSLIVPFAALQVLALYLLGSAVGGSLTGGFATLFLLQTFVWRRNSDIRGTAIAFTTVAIGLAFLLSRRRTPLRTALGGLALGVSIPVNPLIGVQGMEVASLMSVIEWIDVGRPLIPAILALAGGSLFAGPQVTIGLGMELPPLILPLAAFAGAALLGFVARFALRDGARRWSAARLVAIVGISTYVLYQHATRQSEIVGDQWSGYYILALIALGGALVAAHAVWRRPAARTVLALPFIMLLVGLVNHDIASPYRFMGETLEIRSLASEFTTKNVVYWWPYAMTLLAGLWFAMLARRWALGPTLVLALILVIYPLRHVPEPVEYDGAELSVAETWGIHLWIAANGYHGGRADRRWVLDEDWRAIERSLRGEIAAGRLDYSTHVLHISPSISSVEVALGSGVAVDLITPQYDPKSIWSGNGRARGMDALPAAFAKHPRYVVVESYPPTQFPQLADYDELVGTRAAHLFRRRDAS